MKKRNICALLLATLLASTAITGCGTSNSDSGKNSDTASNQTLKIWMPPFGTEDIPDQAFWEEQLKPLTEETGVKIQIEVVPWSNYEEKYLTAITAGQGPDIGYMYSEMLSDFIDMGTLEPLTDYFSDEEKENYIYFDKGNINGIQYTLPIVVGNPSVLFCNMDILNASGFTEPPKTWEDFVLYATKIKEDSPDVQPFQQQWAENSIGGLNSIFYPYLWQSGGNIFSEDGKTLTLDSPEALEAAQFLYDLKFKHDILPDSSTSMTESDVKDAFIARKVAMAVIGSTLSSDLDKEGINWDYSTSLVNKTGGTFFAADALVLLSSSQNKELAAKAMKLMTSASVMEQFHTKLYSMPPITKDEAYNDNPKFEDMYKNDTDYFHTLPVVAGSFKIYDTLYKNLQLMMLDELSPEEALKDTSTYAETILNQ